MSFLKRHLQIAFLHTINIFHFDYFICIFVKTFCLMLPIVQQIATEFKAELEKLYGDELAELILFGSHARGDFHDDSDIDFALVLKNPATTSTSEIMKVSDVGNDLSIKYGQFITYIGMPEFKLQQSNLGIYQEIRKDGIRI